MKKLMLGLLAGTGIAYAWKRMRPAADGWIPAQSSPSQPDDVTLAHKVESEIFRASDVPKGQINVNAELGVVYLRGEVAEQTLIDDLIDRARDVDGVNRVESLLHLPGQDAPMKS